jgi:hypothetical protein
MVYKQKIARIKAVDKQNEIDPAMFEIVVYCRAQILVSVRP